MASPQQRPDPEENRRIYENLERSRRERRATAAAGFAWWWVFWVVIIALAIWWAGWGWGGSGGWWWGGRARTAPAYGTTAMAPGTANTTPANGNYAGGANQAVTTGSGLAVLNATNKQAYVGKQFQVSDVPVQKKVNDRVLWIGAKNATPMLLILSGNGNSSANAHIDKGSLVSVTGTVQKAPPRAQAKSQWSLSGDGADRLEQQGAYIQATQVHAAQS
ncbi:MAG TPA: hypothetical protein VGR47_12725 [Terracidiphilus sp.]|nr:hypothetical protein [Terracidiphilus sp.]